MSPNGRGDSRGSHRPGPDQPSLFVVGEPVEYGLCREIFGTLRGMDGEPDPLVVETALSDVIGQWWLRSRIGDEDPDELFGSALVSFAKEQHSPLGLLVLRTLAVVSPSPDVRDAAAAAAHSLLVRGVRHPVAFPKIGRVTAGRCWTREDVCRDQVSVVIEFCYANQRHGFCVLIDHNLGGIAKDAFAVDDVDAVVAELRAQTASASMVTFREVEPARARGLLERACAAADGLRGEPVNSNFARWRALLLARLRAMPEPLGAPAKAVRPESPIQLPSYVEELMAEGQQRRTAESASPSRRRTPTGAYQIKVSLRGAKPPIWRRLKVPASVTLADLHRIIQYSMGWDDYHLHVFNVGAIQYGVPEPELQFRDEARVRLCDVAPLERARFRYEYDFGDGWEHDVVVEKILNERMKQPVLLAGRRACPPEDCGGIWGYERLLQVLADPRHEDFEELSTWVGGQFDPNALDIDGINSLLDVMSLGPKA